MIIEEEKLKQTLLARREQAVAKSKEITLIDRELARLGHVPATVKQQDVLPNIPAADLAVPGTISELADYITAGQTFRQPELSFAAAYTALSTVLGRWVEDDSEHRTRANTYCIGIAESGKGKNAARSVIKELFSAAGDAPTWNHSTQGYEPSRIGPERIGSHAGLISWVDAQPEILFLLDELGDLLDAVRKNQQATHLQQVMTVLKQMYSDSNTMCTFDAYADISRTKVINQPHCCLYGTTTPQSFADALTPRQLESGFVGRLLVFLECPAPPCRSPSRGPLPQALIDDFGHWIDRANTAPMLHAAYPKPLVCTRTPQAAKYLSDVYFDFAERLYKSSDTAERCVLARGSEKVAKLALTLAASRQRRMNQFGIELQDAERAVRIAEHLLARLTKLAGGIADDDFLQDAERLFRWLQRQTRTWLSTSDIYRGKGLRDLRNGGRYRHLLSFLIDAEKIEEKEVSTGGRTKRLYRVL